MSDLAAGPRGDTAPHNDRWFVPALALTAIAALGVRITYVLIDRAAKSFGGDAHFYHAGANLLAQGHGFIQPNAYALGQTVQAAEHPPMYLLFLSIPSFLGLTSTLTHLVWSCVLGAASVVIVGWLGRVVTSPRVGIIAAVLAALYPNLWIPDGSLEAETAAIFFTALTLLLAYRYWQRPSWPRLVAVGAACGGAALARSELILFVPLLVVPLALLTRTASLRQQLRWTVVAVLATATVIAPWVGYNLNRFQHPVYLSSQGDTLLASANCHATYYGPLIGYFSIPCASAYARQYHVAGDESQQAIGFRRAALDYISRHKGRVPMVVAARLGRILNVFRPSQNLRFREFFDQIEQPVARAALFSYYALAVLAAAGAVVLRRRRRLLFPLLVPIAIALFTVAATYANERFRASADVVLTVLAAVAIDAALARRRVATRATGEREPRQTEPSPVA